MSLKLTLIPIAVFFGLPIRIGDALNLPEWVVMSIPWLFIVWIYLWALISLSLILSWRLTCFIYGRLKIKSCNPYIG